MIDCICIVAGIRTPHAEKKTINQNRTKILIRKEFPICIYKFINSRIPTCNQYVLYLLGGHFSPEKKYLPPPQKNPQFAADTLPAPRPLLDKHPPPPSGIFNKKSTPPAQRPQTPPSPSPKRKIKIKNIRNVRQVYYCTVNAIKPTNSPKLAILAPLAFSFAFVCS